MNSILASMFSIRAAILKRGFARQLVLFGMRMLLSMLLSIFLSMLLSISLNPLLSASPVLGVIPALSQTSDRAHSQFAPQLVEQGRNWYDANQFEQAAIAWQQAAELFTQQGDRLHQAMALTYLSLAYQQQSRWAEAQTAIENSLQLLVQEPPSAERDSIHAQALNVHGRLQLMLGQAEAALETWQQATEMYKHIKDATGVTGSLINQAQALGELGFYRRSCQTLLKAATANLNCDFSDESEFDALLHTFTTHPDRQIQILGLQSFGNLLRSIGKLDHSHTVLQQSLEVAQQATPQVEVAILLDVAETERSLYNQAKNQVNETKPDAAIQVKEQAEVALFHYQQVAQRAAAIASDHSTPVPTPAIVLIQLQAQLQHLSLLIDVQQWLQAHQSTEFDQTRIQQQIDELQASPLLDLSSTRSVIYAQLNFVQSLMRSQSNDLDRGELWIDTALQYATTALQNAEILQDRRSQSFALGTIGQLYEQLNAWPKAQHFTQSALEYAQGIQAEDMTYRWQWQLGRIYAAQADSPTAIDYYQLAFNTLQSLRRDLASLNSEVQFSFQEDIEPVYRQLANLLLQANIRDSHLKQAREVIDALQVAEVENFLQQACSNAELAVIDHVVDQTDSKAAFIYTIILDDRLEVILKLPQLEQLQSHTVVLARSEIEQTLTTLQQLLQQKLPSRLPIMQQYARQVYDWLVAPFADTLTQANVNTLVFVLDGVLRNIPMAALYTGNSYLIQNYAIATAPGIQLVSPNPLKRNTLKALVAGTTTALPEFGLPGLPGVEIEMDWIKRIMPTSDVLLNQEFTSEALGRSVSLRSAPIVHIATHGQFSSRSENTFLVTGDGDRLNINQLGDLLNVREQLQPNPIELLFLSACQTVTGDKRAVLGMAGVAVRSGARSTIASLWYADDEASVELVGQFYQFLVNPNISTKAQALQLAQQALLNNPKFALPVYWSLYVLLGNWL